MKTLLIVCLVGLVGANDYEERFEKMKSTLLKMRASMTWQFGLNKAFTNKSDSELRSMHLATTDGIDEVPYQEPLSYRERLPASFDARQKWPNCRSMRLLRDQSNCGSCWAVSAASVMSDRHCIATNGQQQPYISDQYILSCCGKYCGSGCNGGSAARAMQFWVEHGVPTGGMFGTTSGCQPYSIFCPKCHESSETPPCSPKCIPQYGKSLKDDLHFGVEINRVHNNEQAIMQEIYRHGPVSTRFDVYEDYYFYKSGVYHHVSGRRIGGHAVRMIGWGEERGQKYWLITNSYGKEFGENGMFKIRRGNDECGIEATVVRGTAKRA